MQNIFICKNENHLHLNVLLCNITNIHRALKMIMPHQPARIDTRSRMVELVRVYKPVAQHTFLLFWCAGFFIGSVGLLQALSLLVPIL